MSTTAGAGKDKIVKVQPFRAPSACQLDTLHSIDDRLEQMQEILSEQSPTYEGETGHADCTSQGDELTDDRREFQIINF